MTDPVAPPIDSRDVCLYLTRRQAHMVEALFRGHRRRLERSMAKGDFTPPPGRFDANKSGMTIMDDLIAQLRRQARKEG